MAHQLVLTLHTLSSASFLSVGMTDVSQCPVGAGRPCPCFTALWVGVITIQNTPGWDKE
ncbi:hypothetical protein I79_023465 [Cricetulus griseus]|uniref:Uncharacterized protein n=1 Tax=Cricetulus griseus TaxID=10029 RepID=G3II04_CRIGR|nr:hypothetical protein I79_023465 [Cricetulus griseus]